MKETIECMVVGVEKDCAKARAKLHGDCSSCGLCEGSNAVYYEAINKAGAKCGQSVLLEVEKQSVLKVAFLVFVLPLLSVGIASAIGISIANYLHVSAMISAIILSMIALVPTIRYISIYDAKAQGKSSTPVITKILGE
jgi:sigma-E factor negative regulatory protein RseC